MALLFNLCEVNLVKTCKVFFFLFLVSTGVFAKENNSESAIKFSQKNLIIQNKKISVEIADTSEKQEHGLMYRKKLKTNSGMLFIFQDEAPRSFWMKNTFIPLDIGFFDKNKTLIDIQTMQPVKSVMDSDIPSYASAGPAQYALEVTEGWFEKNKIKKGATFILK